MSGVCTKAALGFTMMTCMSLTGANIASAQSLELSPQPRCGLELESVPDLWTIGYDPLVDTIATKQFDMAVVNHGDAPCTGEIDFDLRGEALSLKQDGDNRTLQYRLISEDGPRDVTPRQGGRRSQADAASFHVQPGARKILRFTMTAMPADMLNAGLYAQTVYLRVNGPDIPQWIERPVVLGLDVASTAMMGLKGEFTRVKGVPTIDLGVLTEGERSLNTSLYVLSTSNYSVSVTSANGGRLRQEDSGWYLPYVLQVGSRSFDFAKQQGQWEVSSLRSRSDDYPLAISLGSVAGRRAGNYSDVVTFTVSAF